MMKTIAADEVTSRAVVSIAGGLLILGLLLSGPQALADHGISHGDATGTGEEESITTGSHFGPPPPEHFCLEVTDSSYRVDMDGQFFADDGNDEAEYNGDATLYWETTETYYIGPQGTYTDADPINGCDTNTLGDRIEAEIWVEEVDPQNGYIKKCKSTESAYARFNEDDIVLDWSGDCKVKDDTGQPIVDTGVVSHSFEGDLDMNGDITNGVWTY